MIFHPSDEFFKDQLRKLKNDPYANFEYALLEVLESVWKIHRKPSLKVRGMLIISEWLLTKAAYSKRSNL